MNITDQIIEPAEDGKAIGAHVAAAILSGEECAGCQSGQEGTHVCTIPGESFRRTVDHKAVGPVHASMGPDRRKE